MKRLVALLALVATQAGAADISFTACPIYRDTDAGKKSGCWLADDPGSGVRYDVSPSPTKPDWNRAVLVEGIASKTPGDPCGGVVLDPVRVSVLNAPCPRHMLLAEGYKGRPFVLPRRNVRPLSEARIAPPAPYAATTFHLFYDVNSSFLTYQLSDWLFDRAITWIRAARPKRIVVTGYAVTGRTDVPESRTIARERADKVAGALELMGIARTQIAVRTGFDPKAIDLEGTDGLVEPSRRRVDIATEF
ncbi:hypothetical protein [Sphingomonas sp. SUN039]|uniref:hypothetical protein n=1 Tax=Sphingomonas sp. SUN039 TaxID=2937787 RepID=UPI00216448CC|nr:hypothetical protein [Sphingomonas sp. SUN039]UVO54378.1 hypothetical protein M0209_09690 [Sphingomonas sp. SUN039]